MHEYDPPPGDGRERGTQALALDGDPSTAWETERYDTPDLGNLKKGVGLYLDAGRPIVARALRVVTPKEGWSYEVRVARDSVPADVSGWTLVASGDMDAERKTIPLDTAGQRSRYYLLWITKLTEGATGGSSAAEPRSSCSASRRVGAFAVVPLDRVIQQAIQQVLVVDS